MTTTKPKLTILEQIELNLAARGCMNVKPDSEYKRWGVYRGQHVTQQMGDRMQRLEEMGLVVIHDKRRDTRCPGDTVWLVVSLTRLGWEMAKLG